MKVKYFLLCIILAACGNQGGSEKNPKNSDSEGQNSASAVYDIIIEDALVMDGTGGEVQFLSDIYIKDGRILKIQKGKTEGSATSVLNGKGKFVIPLPLDASMLTPPEVNEYLERGELPIQIIRMATSDIAKAMAIDDRVGILKEGMQADLLLLNRSPAVDITAVQDVDVKIVNGVIQN